MEKNKKRFKGLGNAAALFATAGFLGIAGMIAPTAIHAAFSDREAEIVTVKESDNNYSEKSTEVKVITYNIAHCRGNSRFGNVSELERDLTIESREQVYECLDNIAEMILNEKADIVLLQETDRDASWSYEIDFVNYLSNKTGLGYYAYGPKYDFYWVFYPYGGLRGTSDLHFEVGNGVLSRYPILSAENKTFDSESFIDWIAGEENYLDCVVDVRKKSLRIISTHFSSDATITRAIEAKKLEMDIRTGGMPTVFGGDLNSVLEEAKPYMPDNFMEHDYTMNIFVNSGLFNIYMAGTDPSNPQYYTAETGDLFKTIDFVIPTKDIEVKEYYVIDAEFSDHKPVAATLVIDEAQ